MSRRLTACVPFDPCGAVALGSGERSVPEHDGAQGRRIRFDDRVGVVESAPAEVEAPAAPFDSPGGGRMAVLSDPSGAAFCVWEPRVAMMAPIGGEGSPDEAQPHWSVDFWVDDVGAAVEGAARSGGRVIVPPYDVPGEDMRQAVLADRSGAAFSVTTVTAGTG